MGRVMLVPATLLLFGLGASGTPPLAAIEPAERGPKPEERPLPRSYHGAAVVNGKIYVMGGAGEDNKPVASVEVYDPATGTWAARASMPYAVGGTTRGRDKLAIVEAYDTARDTWDTFLRMETGTILNRCHSIPPFVYGAAQFVGDRIHVEVRPRMHSRGLWECGRRGPTYDTARKCRLFQFVPFEHATRLATRRVGSQRTVWIPMMSAWTGAHRRGRRREATIGER